MLRAGSSAIGLTALMHRQVHVLQDLSLTLEHTGTHIATNTSLMVYIRVYNGSWLYILQGIDVSNLPMKYLLLATDRNKGKDT